MSISIATQPADPDSKSLWLCVRACVSVGGLICNAECTEWEDEEER